MSSEVRLPHLTPAGEAHMVDVSAKAVSNRVAVAEGLVTMSESTRQALFGGTLPKGDALAAVRLAAIMAAKKTAELIPLCHPLPIDAVEIIVEEVDGGARIVAEVATSGRTGVEMEALTAVSVGALTLYDMVKGIERGVEIGPIRLLRKSGGRSGTWER
ncbi:MAG: cyclic pyranopterin monophosphate synthase MoaC [Actinobacteria bacterium]|nr:cyclic pyranopterin monophosphate synthase MoaC [Acidimicrobiia bacterium]MCA1735391.1 cyclic pyranopterin monophosphate synthase MoaC [Actinomycetota bacterium]